MTPVGQAHEQTLADYFAVVRRYKWVIVAFAIVVPVAALVISTQQAKVYEATADVLLSRQDLGSAVTGIPDANTFTDPDRVARTQAALARIPAVAEAAVKRAGVPNLTADELLSASSVTPQDNADLLSFTVKNGEAGVAAGLATAYAEAFTAHRLAMDTTSLARARKDLQARLAELRRQGGTETTIYRELVKKAQDLRTLELLQDRASVVRSATDASQVAPNPKRNAILGAVLGLLLGIGAAFVWNSLDQRVRDADEIDQALGLPLLARLPDVTRKLRSDGTLAMFSDSPSAATEAVRQLRTNLELANIDAKARTIMITSAAPFEGKSTTLANLAIAMALSGKDVALVDLDLRQPTVARYFGLGGRAGVTDVALGTMPLERALVNVRLPGKNTIPISGRTQPSAPGRLNVLTAGTPAPNPGDFVGTAALTAVLEQLDSTHDVVLIDVPPLLAVGDAMTISSNVDAVLVVVRLGIAERRLLRELARALDACPPLKLGFVLTGVESGEMYGALNYGRYVKSAAASVEAADEAPIYEVTPRGRWGDPRVGAGTQPKRDAGRGSGRPR
jgi:capsular exopolysaccharide synthesis family protein